MVLAPNDRGLSQAAHGYLTLSPYSFVDQILQTIKITHVVSILGQGDELPWPNVGARKVLRLQYDDATYSSAGFIPPTKDNISELVSFAKKWGGKSGLLVHCRPGTSRSPAAAMICLAAIGRTDLIVSLLSRRAYYKPHAKSLRIYDAISGSTERLSTFLPEKAAIDRVDDLSPATVLI